VQGCVIELTDTGIRKRGSLWVEIMSSTFKNFLKDFKDTDREKKTGVIEK
jgi:hypothetical protein